MHLYLMGYRGSGKTTTGKLLAEELNRPLIDTDRMIEACADSTIAEIFAAQGESGFRDLEEKVISEVAELRESSVCSLGGGAILRAANRDRMCGTGWVVWLQGSAEQLYARICGDADSGSTRPQLSDRSGFDEVVEILAQREPIYAELAQKTVSTDGRSPDEIAEEIAVWVRNQERQISD